MNARALLDPLAWRAPRHAARGAAWRALVVGLACAACTAPRAAEPRHAGLIPSSRPPGHPPGASTTAGVTPTVPSASTPALTPPAGSTERPIPPPGVPWGARAPSTLVAAAPDRRWLALCQATRDTTGDGVVDVVVGPQGALSGDGLEGFYVDAGGPGERIDAFVGSDPTGRFVALVRDGRLILRDAATHVDTDLSALGADLRDDLAPFSNPRSGAFAAHGNRFLYLRRDGDRDGGGVKVVVRELGTGGETVIEPPTGELYRADFDASGEWVVLRVVVSDTNGNGKLEWPVPEAPHPGMRCTGPLPRFAVWERPRDEPATFVARSVGGAVAAAPGLVALLGDTIVERDPDGTLARVQADGTRALLVKKSCAARLLHADGGRGLLLVSCLGKKSQSDALLVGPGSIQPLGLELSAVTGDHTLSDLPRLVPLHPGAEAVLVDLDGKSVEHLAPGARILSTAGAHALVLRGRSLLVHELGGRTEAKMGDIDPLAHLLRAGSVVAAPPLIVDVAEGTLLGTTARRPLAVAVDGSVLVPDGRDADATHLAMGPLRWERPRAPPPETISPPAPSP